MRGNTAAPSLVHLRERNMECFIALSLNFAMINDSIFGRDDFRYRVREVGFVLKPDVTLHEGDLTIGTGQNEISRMGNASFTRRSGNINEVERPVDHSALWN